MKFKRVRKGSRLSSRSLLRRCIIFLGVALVYRFGFVLSDVRSTIRSSSASVYYNGVYWNDFLQTRQYMNSLATDDPTKDWQRHLLEWNKGKPFRRALILSCGNGFVERDLYDKGIISSGVGIDIDEELLSRAQASALSGDYPFDYFRMDSNKDSLPSSDFDIVINHAALHHIAYIDFHTRSLYNLLLQTGGILVSFDFVGPHRNQYPDDQWKAMVELNEASDACFRHPQLRYPHLPTMLSVDPSEAVHSELIVETLRRYFEPEWLRFLNGPLAYELLTHNPNLDDSECAKNRNLSEHIDHILREDEAYAQINPGSSLFMYSIMKPRSSVPSKQELKSWSEEECIRERAAHSRNGLYYHVTRTHIAEYGQTL